ncbi:MAG: nitronate monooxygenase [Deltaproteobacteria bacterium]|nr:MAG: nitronate monooxygenase [Deltaproteobacteria bacterium]
MKTRITELLGTEYPIVQGGMMWVGTAELAAAVSNAGGLGIVTALSFPTPDDLAKEIARCREMTSKPFGVNVTVLPSIKPPPYEEYLKVIIESGVKVVETAGRNPQPFMPAFKAAGIKVIHKCTSVRHALKAESIGCDAVSVDGFECAGHPGEDDVTNLVLIPAVAAKVSIPLLASGGIGNGYQMAAAFALGAEGINMGTRFVATQEAPVHENVKQAMVDADERQTTLIFRSLINTVRVFDNKIAAEVLAIEAQPGETDFADIQPLVAGKRGNEEVLEGGDIDGGIWTAGMVMGLINDIPTCEVLLKRIVAEAREAAEVRVSALLD